MSKLFVPFEEQTKEKPMHLGHTRMFPEHTKIIIRPAL